MIAPIVLTTTAGLDSTTLLYRYASSGRDIYPVFVDYGQAQAKAAITLVNWHIDRFRRQGIRVYPLHVEKIVLPASLLCGKSGLFRRGYKPASTGVNQDASTVKARKNLGWVHCRNLMILTACAGYARQKDADLYTGHVVLDKDEKPGRSIPDTSLDFINALVEVWEYSFDKPPRLVCPFIEEWAGKTQVLAEAIARQVPLEKTTSCDYFPPCGRCGACTKSRKMRIQQWQPK